MKLKDKVAIITGSGQGIGKETALALAREGAKIVVSDVTEKIYDVVKEIESLGSEALAVKADVSSSKDTEKMAKKALEKFGRIDILVNNAGICKTSEVIEISEKDWDKTVSVDLKGTFLCSKAVLPTMIKQKYGKIINISSISGEVVVWPKLSDYSAAKSGVVGLTKSIALDYGKYGINVNAIAPGAIWTAMSERVLKELGMTKEQVIQMTPIGRFGEPEDIANLVVFLASNESSFITGQCIVADGGFTIR